MTARLSRLGRCSGALFEEQHQSLDAQLRRALEVPPVDYNEAAAILDAQHAARASYAQAIDRQRAAKQIRPLEAQPRAMHLGEAHLIAIRCLLGVAP